MCDMKQTGNVLHCYVSMLQCFLFWLSLYEITCSFFFLLFFVATYDSRAFVGQCPLLCNVGNTLGSEMPPIRYVLASNMLFV